MHLHARSKVEQSKGRQSAVEPSPEYSNSFFERDFESTSSVKSLRSLFGSRFRALSVFEPDGEEKFRALGSSEALAEQLFRPPGICEALPEQPFRPSGPNFQQLRSTAGAAFSSSKQPEQPFRVPAAPKHCWSRIFFDLPGSSEALLEQPFRPSGSSSQVLPEQPF
mgnify:CR=1 FL=1